MIGLEFSFFIWRKYLFTAFLGDQKQVYDIPIQRQQGPQSYMLNVSSFENSCFMELTHASTVISIHVVANVTATCIAAFKVDTVMDLVAA